VIRALAIEKEQPGRDRKDLAEEIRIVEVGRLLNVLPSALVVRSVEGGAGR